MIGTREVARSHGGDTTFIDNRFDDHIFKLFWALWTPIFGSGNLSRVQLGELQELAKGIYAQRLAALSCRRIEARLRHLSTRSAKSKLWRSDRL